VLIGAGVGVTPLRALLEDLPTSTPVTVVVRARSSAHVVHGGELADLVARRDGHYYELFGSRDEVRLDERTMRNLVGNLHDATSTSVALVTSRTPWSPRHGARARAERLHFETFSF